MRLFLLTLLVGCEPTVREVHEPLPPQATPTPVPVPLMPAGSKPPSAGLRMRARHLLVSYDGARGSESHRSREEALTLAEDRWRQVRKGASLETLSMSASDDITARRGGLLGTFTPGTYAGPIEAAVASTPIGALAPLVETRFGFHVIERLALDEVVVNHLTFGWKGATRSTATRSQASALKAAEAARAELLGGAAAIGIAADARSEAGGDRLGRRQWSAALEEAAFALKVGDVSAPVDSPAGYVVLQRVE